MYFVLDARSRLEEREKRISNVVVGGPFRGGGSLRDKNDDDVATGYYYYSYCYFLYAARARIVCVLNGLLSRMHFVYNNIEVPCDS